MNNIVKKVTGSSIHRPQSLKTYIIFLAAAFMLALAAISTMTTTYAVETIEICIVELNDTNDGIELTWNLVDGAERYEIYRKKKGEVYNKIAIAEAEETYYLDESVDFATYTYYVQPVNDTENWGYEKASIAHTVHFTTFQWIAMAVAAITLAILWLIFLGWLYGE